MNTACPRIDGEATDGVSKLRLRRKFVEFVSQKTFESLTTRGLPHGY